MIDPCTMKGRCTDKRALSFGARPWYDVPAVASNAKPAATACEASTRAPTLAVAGEDRARGSVVYEFWRVGYAPLGYWVLHKTPASGSPPTPTTPVSYTHLTLPTTAYV